MPRTVWAVLAVALLAPPTHAGMYSPDEPCPFPVQPDGTARPLPFTQFQILYAAASAGQFPLNPANPGTLDWAPTDDHTGLKVQASGVLLQRLAARYPKAAQLTGSDLAGYTASQIRLGGYLQVIQRLTPETRSRTPNYLLLANLAHAHAAAAGTPADWDTALSRFAFALDCDPPAPPPGTSAEQLKWQMAVDRKQYRLWLRLRREEKEKKPPIAVQVPDAVFEDADGKPIRFWESEAEAKKLPPDALAAAQQLALWTPWDPKLLWTVGELYLAGGGVREAKKIYEMCAEGRQFSGPAVFRDNRTKALELVAKLPKDEPLTPAAVEGDPQLGGGNGEQGLFGVVDRPTFYVVGGLFAVAAVALLWFQVRSVVRRLGR